MAVLTRHGSRIGCRPFAALLLCALLMTGGAKAEAAGAVDENRVKAAFLYKFGTHVEWPAGAFASADSPLMIGVVGDVDLAAELSRVAAGRQIDGRPIVVRDLTGDDSLLGAHVLFVGSGGRADVEALLATLNDTPALIVTETQRMLPSGSVINFVIVDDRVRFDVALPAAERRHLKISSLLLRVARHVEPIR
jgi:hypothetical protein